MIKVENGITYKLIFCTSIKKGGKTIYPKKAKFFKFWIKVKQSVKLNGFRGTMGVSLFFFNAENKGFTEVRLPDG